MAQQIIDIGNNANDGTGDTIRQAGSKINAMFDEACKGKRGKWQWRGFTMSPEAKRYWSYQVLRAWIEGSQPIE